MQSRTATLQFPVCANPSHRPRILALPCPSKPQRIRTLPSRPRTVTNLPSGRVCQPLHLGLSSIYGVVTLLRYKWSYRDLNPGPPACKAGALPTELQPHTVRVTYYPYWYVSWLRNPHTHRQQCLLFQLQPLTNTVDFTHAGNHTCLESVCR